MAKTNLKILWKDIKGSPAILITFLVIVIFIIYYVYKQNNATSGGAAVPTTGTNTAYLVDTSLLGGSGTTTGGGTTGGGTTTTTGGGTTTTGGGGTTGIVGKTFTAIKSGSLEDNPRGKVLNTIPQGGSFTVLTKTTKPDPGGTSKVYYWVNYNGKHGWLGSDVFNVNS